MNATLVKEKKNRMESLKNRIHSIKKQNKKTPPPPPINVINIDNNFQVSCTKEKMTLSEIEATGWLSEETLIYNKMSGCQT